MVVAASSPARAQVLVAREVPTTVTPAPTMPAARAEATPAQMAPVVLAAQTPLAQTAPAASAEAAGIGFLTRSAFHLSAAHLSNDDPRYVWDTNFGGDLDLVDYGRGRLNFLANYQAILGEEFRAFDPNQGNYILAGELTARARAVEIGAVFYHQSRHLGDRAKRQPVDWNMFGVRAEGDVRSGALGVHLTGDARGVVQKSFVDYRWEVVGDARADYRVAASAGVFAGGGLRLLGTDGSRDRGTQTGVRVEGGVRTTGRGAAVELFAAVERKIDPYPLEIGADTWVSAGFRLLSR
jgi:hypothetical protein